MRRANVTLIVCIVCLLAPWAAAGAVVSRQLLPIIRNGQAQPSVVTLVESDSTFVGATADATGRIVLTYIDRAHGNKLHVVEDVGDHVVELIDPIATQTAPIAPTFEVDGPKQADGVPLIVGDKLHVYFTSRDVDDPTGPFRLKRLTMDWPQGVQP